MIENNQKSGLLKALTFDESYMPGYCHEYRIKPHLQGKEFTTMKL
ncbi:hypothetical protein QE390_000973 [Siphonobacter sp. SORGH_AS 1065]|nr:hypothetical protein [Siphonobacter sp. SORGH_AS_1065]